MDADTKLVAGPIWDLDGTLGRVSTSYVNITDRTAEKSGSGWYNDIISNDSAFFQLLGKHESFMRRVYEVYNENKDKFNGSNGILNDLQTQRSKIADSAEMNFVRWSKYMTNTEHFTISQNGQKYGNDSYAVTYKKTDNWSNFVDNLKEYITKRLSFFSDKLTVTAPVAGDITGTTSVYEDESLSLTANCTANSYKWQSSDNGTDWTDIAGATKKTYSVTAKTSMNGLYIRYIATNKGTTINTTRVAKAAASASAISTPVQLTVNTVPAHEHLWGEPEYTWLDNYTKCKVTRTCSVDGCKVGTETKTVNSTSEVTKAATCTTDGERTYTADFGDQAFTVQTKVVPIPATGHSYGTVTYTWEKDYSKCTASRVCANNPSHTETETVDSTSKVTKDPTCTRTGTRTYTASFQNKAFTSQTKTETIEATGHNYGNATYSWSNDKSRCTASRVCANNASHTETETVNAASQVTKDATCTAEGEKTQTATFRNTAFETQTTTAVIPAKGHNYGAVTYTWENDLSKCTATRVCANDATHKETETVNTSSRVTREPNCTGTGERTYTASFVNKAFTSQTKTETIAAKGHNYGKATYSWNNDKSRCTASRVCANNASHTETETVNATSQVTKDATCTAEGEKTQTATFRNTAFETQTTTAAIPAKGHNYGNVTYTWNDDNSKCTASRVCANDATHKETETVNTSSRVTRQATCTGAGERTYTASFVNKAFTGQTKTEVIAAKGHNYGKVTYSWNDDKSRCTASRVCANDGSHTETETVNAASQVTKDATCTAEGERTYTASFRNTAFETQTTTAAIAAKGHNYGAVTYTWADDLSKCTASRVCANDTTHKETETVETSSKVTKDATCTVAGERTYAASFENKAFTSQTKTEPITAKGHNYGAVTYTWADDLSKCTASRVCANDKTHTETETVNTSSKVTKEATCTVEGERTYTASFENKAFTSQTKTEPIAAKGHNYGVVTYTWADDLTKCTASRVCANDETHKETETVPASTQITKPATTTEMGETTYTAVFTNKAFLEQKQTVTDIPVLQKDDPETSPEGSSDGTNNGSSSNNGSSVNDETNNNSELSKEDEPTSSLPEKMDLPSVKISSLRAGKKYMTVRWKKIKKKNRRKIGKIEIQIAQDSKFTKIIKRKSVSKNKTFKKITGLKLKSKTRYWVRIRAYKKTEDVKHVSAWKVKKIRVK